MASIAPIGSVHPVECVDLDAVNAPPCGPCDTGFHSECTGCDCPVCRVYLADPYQYAPAEVKAARDFLWAKVEAVASGEKQVASIGRILPHRRVSAPRGGR